MRVGSLLQYKEEFYGRFYSSLPKVPFEQNHQFMPSIHKGSFDDFAQIKLGSVSSWTATGRKKYILISTHRTVIAHPRIPCIDCAYIKCFISDPYVNNETTDGWMQESWVEPLNEMPTYREEHLKAMQEAYEAKIKHISSTNRSVLDIYQEMKGRRK